MKPKKLIAVPTLVVVVLSLVVLIGMSLLPMGRAPAPEPASAAGCYYQVWQMSDDPSGAPNPDGYSEWDYLPSTDQHYRCEYSRQDLSECDLYGSGPTYNYDHIYVAVKGKLTYDYPADPKYVWYEWCVGDDLGLGIDCDPDWPSSFWRTDGPYVWQNNCHEVGGGCSTDEYCGCPPAGCGGGGPCYSMFSRFYKADDTKRVWIQHYRNLNISGAWQKEDPIRVRWFTWVPCDAPTPTEPPPPPTEPGPLPTEPPPRPATLTPFPW